jgi:hypothetical protein
MGNGGHGQSGIRGAQELSTRRAEAGQKLEHLKHTLDELNRRWR